MPLPIKLVSIITAPAISLTVALTIALAGAARAQPAPSPFAQQEAVQPVSPSTPEPQSRFNVDEARVAPYELPDLFGSAESNGSMTLSAWRARREAIREHFREQVYGRSPGQPTALRFQAIRSNPRAMDGAATMKRIAIHSRHAGRTHRFVLTLMLPNGVSGPVPVFLLLNHRSPDHTDPTREKRSPFWPAEEMIARGYGIAAVQTWELAPDHRERYREGAIALFDATLAEPRRPDAWGALSAWAWGASRALDYLQTDSRVDRNKVAVVGHSRAGKAALWAAAQDERFAMAVSNNSGEGGAALARRNFGETVAQVNQAFPHWFAENYKSYADREQALPVDQHMLLALIAPRALYVASAEQDTWSDPKGEFLSLASSSPAYALWKQPAIDAGNMPPLDRPMVVGTRGYHIRSGGHGMTAYDWERFADFADRVWPRPGGGK